jgi:molybdopterin molybdotransferase
MQEDVTLEGETIVVNADASAGEFVRRRGGDVAAGQKLISAGDRIRPQMAALLAAQGLVSCDVGGQVRAAIISTGDELAAPNAPLQAGQIYDSNSVLLQVLLEQAGVNVVSVAHCADRSDEIESAIRAGTACDVMIITGGVSVGARDLVKDALAAAGATLDLWRVAVKPGKPFLFGRAGACAVFGLPGNPVSAFVTFLLFVRPALLKLMGANEAALSLTRFAARLSADVRNNDSERPHYIRGHLGDGSFAPVGRQESHALFGLARSNALLLVRPGEQLTAGAAVTALTWE